MNYYVPEGGTQKGPFPPEQLAGQGLRADTLVWAEGMAEWQRADHVPELRAIVAAAPEPVPPVVPPPPPGAHGAYVPNYASGPYPPNVPPYAQPDTRKIAAGICGIMLGAFGVHKFILGFHTAGVIMLLATVLTCGFAGAIMHVIGIVEGIIYLTKSDAEFHQLYVVQKKEWF